MIDDGGAACIADFGIASIITDSTIVDPDNTTTPEPGVVRYMAPELLNPSQFHLQTSLPTKESDVYSLAVTAYEVGSVYAAYCITNISPTLTGSHRGRAIRGCLSRCHSPPHRDR